MIVKDYMLKKSRGVSEWNNETLKETFIQPTRKVQNTEHAPKA